MFAAAGDFHSAHDVGVEKGAEEKGGEAGGSDARGQTEDEAEGGVAFPEGSGRQGHGQLKQGDHGEVDGKAQPDDEPRLAEAPDFGNAVVDDVGDGKDQESGGDGDGAELEDLGFQKIRGHETGAEHDAEQHEREGDGSFHDLFFTWFSSTRLKERADAGINLLRRRASSGAGRSESAA